MALGSLRHSHSRSVPVFSSLVSVLLLFFVSGVATAKQQVIQAENAYAGRGWSLGESIAVECLNRTIETGEHVMNENGELQYIPFWTCSETGKPLELSFGSEKDINCTIAQLDDPLFHILEFYIHNDAPLSCRVPSLPPASHGGKLGTPIEYTHLQFALTGALQLSHIHINPQLNLLLHTQEASLRQASSAAAAASKEEEEANRGKKKGGGGSPAKKKDGRQGAPEGHILAAAAYSLPPTSASPKLVIGDPLPLTLRVRWYSSAVLPPSTSRLSAGLGGHVHLSTAAYCLLSFGAGLAVSIAYFRGIDMPRRLKRYGAEKLGGGGEGRGGGYGYAYVPGGFPGGGYGGAGGGYGGGGAGGGMSGKRD